MQPFAYGLREHEIFDSPSTVDRGAMVEIKMPPYFADNLDGETIEVLPITKDSEAKYNDGWCTYTYAIDGCPEMEVFCGGVNDKTPSAGALWRQGHLLHFGFEPPPSEFNDAGKAMLVNSIAYIARFVDDRPILYTPSPFQSDVRYFRRSVIHSLIKRGEKDRNRLKYYTTKETFAELREMDLEPLRQWAERSVDFLKPGEGGKLEIDPQAVKFGVAPASKEFLAAAIEVVRASDDGSSLARTLLDRYVPDGPAERANHESWAQWYEENADYLFFSDSGGYRWYIDPLAKKRSIPTKSLRGIRRATL